MPRKKMGNKALSPSLAAFGFTSKKRHSDGGGEVSPSKRIKIDPTKSDLTAVVDITQDSQKREVVDLSQDSSSSEEVKKRRGQRSRFVNLADDEAAPPPTNEAATASTFRPHSTPPKPKSAPTSNSLQSSPQRPLPNAIGFASVPDPNHIICATAAAKARTNPEGIHRLFPGAIIGRPSTASDKDDTFINLGIPLDARGISRKHVTIVRISDVNSRHDDDVSVLTAYSTNSVRSTASVGSHPKVLIKVCEHPNPRRKTLAVKIHRTRRDKRMVLDLKQGECKTLIVGDALCFHSEPDNYYYSVVAFYDAASDVGDALNLEGVMSERAQAGDIEARSVGGENSCADMTQEVVNGGHDEIANDQNATNLRHDTASATQNLPVGEPKKKTTADKDVKATIPIESKKMDIETDTKITQKHIESINRPIFSVKEKAIVSEVKAKSELVEDVTKQTPVVKMSPVKLKSPSRISSSRGVATPKLNVNPAKSVNKGDRVRVVYQLADAFGIEHEEWYYGKVGLVRSKQGSQNINIALDSGEYDNFDLPHPEVEAIDMSSIHSEKLKIGDFVECNFQNCYWYHGRVADINDDGTSCEVLYHDKDYEINIPTNQQKIRISRQCGSDYRWLINKPTIIGRKGTIILDGTSSKGECRVAFGDGSEVSILCEDVVRKNGAFLLSNCKPPKRRNAIYNWLHNETVIIGQQGIVKDAPCHISDSKCRVQLEDGTEKLIHCDDVVKGAFAYLLQEVGLDHQYFWPESDDLKSISAAQQNETSILNKAKDAKKSSGKRVSVKFDDDDDEFEPVSGHHLVINVDGIAASPTVDETEKRVARPLPPGIPNMLWHAINCPEAKTGYNMLQEFLYVHDRVPGQDLIRKFWQLMIEGPKADGHNIFFKDPFRTELASQYIYSLLHHSNRLVRDDGSALFGPSEWADIESLLSQPITQTENMVAGKRLADGLHLAARGTKLLLLMLQTELRDVNLASPNSISFERMPLQAMPTVRLLRTFGLRTSLKEVVKHTTRCLVGHSRFILDVEDFHPQRQSCKHNIHDESCVNEASACFENLGCVISYIASLFCVEGKIPLDHHDVSDLIQSQFEPELKHCIDELPDMNTASTKKFREILTETFIGAIGGDFSLPLFISLSKLMGYTKELAGLGLYGGTRRRTSVQLSSVNVFDDVFDSNACSLLHELAVDHCKRCERGSIFLRTSDEKHKLTPLEKAMDTILDALNDTSPIVEYWSRSSYINIDAHADIDEDTLKQDGVLKCPKNAHVLYMQIANSGMTVGGSSDKYKRMGPTVVFPERKVAWGAVTAIPSITGEKEYVVDVVDDWNRDENSAFDTEEVAIVPAKTARLLRFDGRAFHAVPKPPHRYLMSKNELSKHLKEEGKQCYDADEYWDDEDDDFEEEEIDLENLRSVLLFNTWPTGSSGPRGVLPDEVEVDEDDIPEEIVLYSSEYYKYLEQMEEEQRNKWKRKYGNDFERVICNEIESWKSVSIDRISSTAEDSMTVPLMGNPSRRGCDISQDVLRCPLDIDIMFYYCDRVSVLS